MGREGNGGVAASAALTTAEAVVEEEEEEDEGQEEVEEDEEATEETGAAAAATLGAGAMTRSGVCTVVAREEQRERKLVDGGCKAQQGKHGDKNTRLKKSKGLHTSRQPSRAKRLNTRLKIRQPDLTSGTFAQFQMLVGANIFLKIIIEVSRKTSYPMSTGKCSETARTSRPASKVSVHCLPRDV